jgi:hypothetical protein
MTYPLTALAFINQKIRRLTGTATSNQLPDVGVATGTGPNATGLTMGLNNYVNSFYLYDLPAQFRSLKLKDKYTFNTIEGVDTYAFDSEHYTTLEMPCYVAKREVQLWNDPWSFYATWFNWQHIDTVARGNGTAGPYSWNINAPFPPPYGFPNNSPIIPSFANDPTNLNYPAGRNQNILITANVEYGTTMNVSDDGFGNLNGNCLPGGTIDYFTGVVTNLNFSSDGINPTVIPPGQRINMNFIKALPNIPLGILFFQNTLTLRPVPDRGYTVELVTYRQPTQALQNTPAEGGVAELNEWWELIAVGAAKKIYEDRLDAEGIALMDKMLKERYDIVYSRTYAQIGSQRIQTLFADQLQYNYGQSGGMFGSV